MERIHPFQGTLHLFLLCLTIILQLTITFPCIMEFWPLGSSILYFVTLEVSQYTRLLLMFRLVSLLGFMAIMSLTTSLLLILSKMAKDTLSRPQISLALA
uniref:Peptidyl-prolyl cis-trans isomerase FKBP18ic n=1 Tax=Rhizophora mucronata TaxID=61149 RepID=A0A2P2JPQ2_RHIMU